MVYIGEREFCYCIDFQKARHFDFFYNYIKIPLDEKTILYNSHTFAIINRDFLPIAE